MVFKTVLRGEPQQVAQVGHAGGGITAIHGQGVVGELILTQVAFHMVHPVIGPGFTLPLPAPKHFDRPMISPSTSSSEISGVWPMKDWG